MRDVELCQCPTIGAFVERQVTYYCSTCGKAVPDPDDPTRPAVAGRFDAPKAEAKVLRVARVEQEGGVPAEPPNAGAEPAPSLYGPCSQGCGRTAERSGYVTALGVYCECGGLFAGVQIKPPADLLASVREALSARCPSTDGPHVFGPLGTNGWQCGCGLTLNEATLRALEAKPGPPKAAPLGGPAAFYAAVKIAAERGGA